MPVMLGALYDALKAANVPDDKARGAAEELAGYENQFKDLKSSLAVVKVILVVHTVLLVGILWTLVNMGTRIWLR